MSKNKNTWQLRNQYLEQQGITYLQYLETEHWKDLKKRFRASKLCKNRCAVCGSRQNINIHHKSYKRIGNERLMDLIELCRNCHTKAHDMDRHRTSQKHNLWNAHKRVKA